MEKPFSLNNNNWGILKKIFYFFGFVLFSMMIVTPSAYQLTKAFLIFIIMVGIATDLAISKKVRMHPRILYIFLFYILMGLLFGFYGYLRQNSGAIPITKEVVFYVIIYMILINGIVDFNSLRFIHIVLVFSMAFLCFYLVASILNAFNIWPDWMYYSLQTESTNDEVNTYSIETYGRFSASFSSFPSLLFLQPYYFCFLILQPGKKSKLMWILFVVMTLIMVFVGRRILMIIALSFPLIILIFISSKKNNSQLNIQFKSILFYFILLVLGIYLIITQIPGLNIQSIVDYFLFTFQSEQISSTGAVESNVRLETIRYLYNGWLGSPIFGFGSGASCPGYIRSPTEPWNYEVAYMQFIYSWGIVGCLLYLMGIYFIINKLVKIYRQNSVYSIYAVSSLVGMAAFLIGASTNPYLLQFDFLFVIFLPIAIINLNYLKK